MAEYLKKNPSLWPQIVDTGQIPMELYGFDAIPMIMLFGPDGQILARDLRGGRLVETVESYIAR